MKKFRSSILMCLFSLYSFSQEKLTIQQAIEIAMKNNYSIMVAKNEAEISKNNASPGNAGMLPEVTANTNMNFAGSDTKQEFVTGNIVDKKGAQSSGIGTGLGITWNLFDGMKMFAAYDKLKEWSAMGEITIKIQIENTLAQVIAAYYDIARKKQLLRATDSILSISEERVKISSVKIETGSSAKTDLLQAQVDRNAQKAARIKQEAAIQSLKAKLNYLLSRSADTNFDVTDEIEINKSLALDELKNTAMSKNSSLLLQQKNISVSEFALKEFRAQRYPTIGLNATYNFSRTENQAGFLLYNQNLGWNAGLTASWTLFNGFNTNRTIKNAQIEIMSSKLMMENIKSEIQSGLQTAFANYKTALEVLTLEEENENLAKENMDIMLERFRLGSATSLEMKEAQRSYEEALVRLLQTRYNAKLAETELLRLKGELVR